MRYVFRISTKTKQKLDAVAPPRKHKRSGLIRDAIVNFLCKPVQPLADRPHIRGQKVNYHQVCAILSEDQVEAIKRVYPDVSVSVVIQAAVMTELRRKRYKQPTERGPTKTRKRSVNDSDEDTHAHPRTGGHARKP